ncbi:pantothenate synthetase [Tothia fuscella]|uniref:Pantoate--beta-alanine ligase n=1 Tax=Tothia fuscella TaxID=1048955 RepID=A0A9P4TVU8_9PEZI|nr:pantothenate synthetase [Tothia fuscella]
MSTDKTHPSFAPSFKIFHEVPALRQYRKTLTTTQRTVGLVPTMGALHDGHLSLVRQAATENTDVFISIYVNPTQFGVSEDLSTYPKTWESDMKLLEIVDRELASTSGCGRISAIFAPSTGTMYPTLPPTSEVDGKGSFVTITPVGEVLEGKTRPVFFRGVATVCMKLFNIVTPERVYFGQKDVQQTVIIKRMVKDFHIDTDVRIGETKREEDGLAMSSRNVYLGSRRRAVATVLSQALFAAQEQYLSHKKTSRGDILWIANDIINEAVAKQEELPSEQRARFEVDYISLADPESLEEVDEVEPSRGAVLSGAIKMLPLEDPVDGEDTGLGGGIGSVRLIDNIVLREQAV